MVAAIDALKDDGQCEETGWPYLLSLPASTSSWIPPITATPIFKRQSQVASHKISQIVKLLDLGQPMILTLLLGERFYVPSDGVVDRGQNDEDTTYHAVLAVGYGEVDGKKLILVRNSWGSTWGINGHAWVTARYLQKRLTSAAVVST